MTTYAYVVKGTAANEQAWSVSGEITNEKEGDFPSTLDGTLQLAFMQLTQGKAVYGKPGVGCNGPYKITDFILQRV